MSYRGVYVDGTWRTGDGEPVRVLDPSDEGVIADIASASPEQVDAALAAARRAAPGWARTPAGERGRLLRRMADVIHAHSELLARTLVREVGKRASEAAGEVAFAESFLRYNAEWDLRLEGEILPGDVPGEQVQLLRVPLGVVAAICPWNFPLAVLCRKLGPALVTGNTVVVKPSEVTPVGTVELFRLFDEELDIPAGVLNLVVGGPDAGRRIVESGEADLVTFTGHRETGKAVMAAASRNLTRVSLELGGKAPAIVWRDADLDRTVPAILEARHTNCGQVCTSAERVLVHRDVLDEFTERYVDAVRAMRLGDPAGGADLGPLVSQAQLDKVEAAVAAAVQEGAKVLTGGRRPAGDGFASGYWYEPTVFGDVSPRMRIMREETFGPVTPIVGFDDLAHALSVANDSRYGLSAYVFSKDYSTVMRTVDELEFGEIYVNRTLGESVHAHHAGWKESGMGGEDGKWGVLRYTQIKTAYHRFA
ncbi:aldehyde dehydrogenase family protein [Phytohabitans flavus]|uniref:Aldehyde dehydrogenase n=2 Tax=Phytohabitans flavus TaxID=1076124 RepID=A0A6F8XS26_9ACTN|nr:aldehyde dehydrogenase family protein [Phytohabitans flavus]BCB76597.1 aldehyde dehydrogenase [Phytohabitans flavus]